MTEQEIKKLAFDYTVVDSVEDYAKIKIKIMSLSEEERKKFVKEVDELLSLSNSKGYCPM